MQGTSRPFGQHYGLAIQPDGRIVAAGVAHVVFEGANFAVTRYNPDGSLDGSFGGGAVGGISLAGSGRAITNVGLGALDDAASSVAIQPDGKLVAAG